MDNNTDSEDDSMYNTDSDSEDDSMYNTDSDSEREKDISEAKYDSNTQGRESLMWLVDTINSDGIVAKEHLDCFDVYGFTDKKVILEFGPHDQPEGGSGGLFDSWLRYIFPLRDLEDYDDWKQVAQSKKDEIWDVIQSKFHLDASNEKYKKSVMKSLGQKCKAYKNRLWELFRKDTFEETIKDWPRFKISEEKWKAFVQLRFSEKAKMDNNGSHTEEEQDVDKNECEQREWVVTVIDSYGNIAEDQRLTCQDVSMFEDRKVILEFGPHNQPVGESRGLFDTFLPYFLKKIDYHFDDPDGMDEAWDFITAC